VELIKHLNGSLRNFINKKKQKMNPILEKILMEGFIYCQNSIKNIEEIVSKYEQEINGSKENKLT